MGEQNPRRGSAGIAVGRYSIAVAKLVKIKNWLQSLCTWLVLDRGLSCHNFVMSSAYTSSKRRLYELFPNTLRNNTRHDLH
jgi:hypothetical protein